VSNNVPRPYAPSWIDHFTDWVDRLPWSNWVTYIGIGIVVLLIQALALWFEGAHPVGFLPLIHVFFATMVPISLAIVRVLDNMASVALLDLGPALKASEREYGDLEYQLTTLPAWPALLAGPAVVAITILLDRGALLNFGVPSHAPVSIVLVYVIFKLLWWFFATLAYHSVHQLKLIDRILTQHTHINPFRITPLYAFSKLTALTAAGLAVPPYFFFALNPDLLYDPIALAQASMIIVLAVAVFVWPLLGARRLLAKEKNRLLDRVSQRMEATYNELHQQFDNGDLVAVDEKTKVIEALEAEQQMLKGIPTWPWQPETMRYLVSALVLPLALWIIQYILQRMVAE